MALLPPWTKMNCECRSQLKKRVSHIQKYEMGVILWTRDAKPGMGARSSPGDRPHGGVWGGELNIQNPEGRVIFLKIPRGF